MSDPERDFIKEVDAKILDASKETLEHLQELDRKSQLKELTFYDAYAKSSTLEPEETAPSEPKVFRKSKGK